MDIPGNTNIFDGPMELVLSRFHFITPPPSLSQLEMPFLEKANLKSEKLRASVQKMDTAARRYTVSVDMSFIEEAIRELLASRRVLIASYPFGYYVNGHRARRFFENIQVCPTSLLFGGLKVYS